MLRCALHILSGRIILYFGVKKRLRTFLYPIFTGGVVTASGSCSAAFCESAARPGTNPLSHGLRRASSPEGGALAVLTAR